MLGVLAILALGAVAVWLILPRDTEAVEPSPTPEPSPTTQSQPRPQSPMPSPTASPEPSVEPVLITGSPAFTSPIIRLEELTDVVYTVDPIGQGAGVEQFAAGEAHVVMALPGLIESHVAEGGGACVAPSDTYQFLVNAQMTYLVFNIEGVEELILDGPAVAAIYSGEVRNWSDPMIAAINPDATLPDLAITPIYRSGSSSMNGTVQRWMSATADWEVPEADTEWSMLYGVSATGAELTELLRSTPGAISYARFLDRANLPVADILLGGQVIAPEPETLQGHLDQAVIEPTTLPDPLTVGAYPLVDFAYLVACMEYADPEVGESVRALLEAAMSKEGQAFFSTTSGVEITHTNELERARRVR